ncbi:hypothetical protein L6164_000216 [Bauhinia variegata]|uniref:Uncharacterized protein n=1 Tax=Bauhinia variegata TaxID=167791 RepID=A0ACB9Q587_BAUVA|nr:hypothetical protein L6164_000216 [Bauhinia variegata]
MNLSMANLPQQLSFSRALTSSDCLFLHNNLSHLSISQSASVTPKPSIIRMGGGPRTYPGGVSKWQWKRMQAKKAKQLLKARLCRERQIYEMRKRAELKAAVSELEKPWEVVETAPNLFSVKADEQLKVLADRFQKAGGFDMWTERDGPQLFQTPDELPSARFFPKGVVHSIKPYKKISEIDELDGEEGSESQVEKSVIEDQGSKRNRESSSRKLRSRSNGQGRRLLDVEDSSDADSSPINSLGSSINSGIIENEGNKRIRGSSIRRLRSRSYSQRRELPDVEDSSDVESSPINTEESLVSNGMSVKRINGNLRNKGNRRKFPSRDPDGSNGSYLGRVGSGRKQRGYNPVGYNRSLYHASRERKDSDSEVYDMSLQDDGSYGVFHKSGHSGSKFGETLD